MSGFASTKDLADKAISFNELAPGLYGYTAEGDPNSGVVIGDDSVLVVDAQATPLMAQDVLARIRGVTDKPVRHVVLSHYHAVRVLGASAYTGAEIIASDVCRDMIAERGQQDADSEIGRFPRLFRGRDSIPDLTWPTLTFHKRMTLHLGGREVQVIHIGRSHTAGDTVVWLPKERVLFSGDVVEFGATPYCGDAHFADWPGTLAAAEALGAEALVPGRGRALVNAAECREAIEGTRAFTSDLFAVVQRASAAGAGLKEVYDQAMAEMRPKYGEWVIFEHCMPFNVARAHDEARGLDHPRIWTAERDVEMWRALEQGAAAPPADGRLWEALMPYAAPRYASAPPPSSTTHHPAVVVGGGLVGLTLALDLAQRGVPVVVLDDDDTVSTGSRAICFAQRTLEIFGRLGLGQRMLEKGITWNVGRVFFGERQLFDFDLLPEDGHEYPAFINLQQYYAEEWLIEACQATGLVDLRWRHAVAGVESRTDGAAVTVETPAGTYALTTDWLIAADGARSVVRRRLGLSFVGKSFYDRFLIADVVMQAPRPAERWFWFDPPFHPHQSALLHKQPDDVWRIDLQLGWDADPEEERQPERVIPRVQAMLGPDVAFKLEWVSVYTFHCRRLERFVHNRVVFVGDSAHQVSPFGARGGNGGVQDADNLGWKLAAAIAGTAGPALIGSYDAERIAAADENIGHSTRATNFITPKTDAARAYRDAALMLAARHPFARPLVNSGRLSRPARLLDSPLNARDGDEWPGCLPPGAPAMDAPVTVSGRPDWLLRHVAGPGFSLLVFGGPATPDIPGVKTIRIAPDALDDVRGVAARRYGAAPGACVLLRPDGHVAALFHRFDRDRVTAAMRHAQGHAASPVLERVA